MKTRFADRAAIAPKNEVDEDIATEKLAHAHDEDDDAADDKREDQRLHFGMHRPFPGAGKYPAEPQDRATEPEAAEDENGIDDEADGDIGRCRQGAHLPRQAGQDVTALKGENRCAGESA